MQTADAAAMGYELVVNAQNTIMATMVIETDEDKEKVLQYLRGGFCAVFGVFPPPIQWKISLNMEFAAAGIEISDGVKPVYCPCFASWNITRTPLDGKPTFTHKEWVKVGLI